MIIFGYSTRLTKARTEDILKNACPSCQGNLELHDLKRWFTLYFIPIFPFSTIETCYKCDKCKQTYKQEIKKLLHQSQKQREEFKENAQKSLYKSLVACLTYLAQVDGKICAKEQKQIDSLLKNSKDKTELKKVINHVKKAKDKQYVLKILQEAKQFLTAEGIFFIIAVMARMVLADGQIDKKEEALMKEFLEAFGVPQTTYSSIIESVKKKMGEKK